MKKDPRRQLNTSGMIPLGKRIRYLRLLNKLTMKQLHELSGVHSVNISRIERGDLQNFELRTIDRIAKAMGCIVTVDLQQTGKVGRIDYRYLRTTTRGVGMRPKPQHPTPEQREKIVRMLDEQAPIHPVYKRKIKPRASSRAVVQSS